MPKCQFRFNVNIAHQKLRCFCWSLVFRNRPYMYLTTHEHFIGSHNQLVPSGQALATGMFYMLFLKFLAAFLIYAPRPNRLEKWLKSLWKRRQPQDLRRKMNGKTHEFDCSWQVSAEVQVSLSLMMIIPAVFGLFHIVKVFTSGHLGWVWCVLVLFGLVFFVLVQFVLFWFWFDWYIFRSLKLKQKQLHDSKPSKTSWVFTFFQEASTRSWRGTPRSRRVFSVASVASAWPSCCAAPSPRSLKGALAAKGVEVVSA